MSRDTVLVRYVEKIEDHLGRLSGKERVLAPPEFALARQWYRAGIPISWILRCFDDVLVGADTPSLAACRERIESLCRERRGR